MKDTEIIEMLKERNEEAINVIELQFGTRLKNIIRNIVKDEEDVSECLNDVYMKVWNSIPPTEPENLEAYLSTAAKNTAINRYNSKNRKTNIPEQMIISADDDNFIEPAAPERTDETVENMLREEKIRALMIAYVRGLPQDDQKIFVARFYYNTKIRIIAKKVGCPVGTVKSALNRMKKGVTKYLRKEGIEDE